MYLCQEIPKKNIFKKVITCTIGDLSMSRVGQREKTNIALIS